MIGPGETGRRLALWLALGAGLPLATSVAAQDLELFESVESRDEVERPGSGNSSSSSSQRGDSGSPMFTLVGTSRFGDRYRARLRTSSDEVITVEYRLDQSAPVPGFPGFTLRSVGARHVVVQHPEHTPCADFADEGVSCRVGDNSARLELATAEPIERAEPEPDEDSAGEEDGADGDNGERTENPFAAALRDARERSDEDQAAIRARAQRFERRRISEDEVPEGYRVVSTPFGDRLVPDRD